MAKEYIERERAKEHLIGDYAYAAAKMLDDIPAADVVEVKHGEWIWQEVHGIVKNDFFLACSVCLEIRNADSKHNYCPNCGAKMDLKGGAKK